MGTVPKYQRPIVDFRYNSRMKKLGDNLAYLVASMAGDDEQARINYRAHQVRSRYRQAIETVYRDTAELFLAHTNNVYIMKKDGVTTLIVYVDESIFAAELNAQRELIKLKLLELFGEQVEEFEIYVSRGNYKQYHPYLDADAEPGTAAPAPLQPLDESETNKVRATSENIEDESVRESFQKAMTADLARKNIELGEKS